MAFGAPEATPLCDDNGRHTPTHLSFVTFLQQLCVPPIDGRVDYLLKYQGGISIEKAEGMHNIQKRMH